VFLKVTWAEDKKGPQRRHGMRVGREWMVPGRWPMLTSPPRPTGKEDESQVEAVKEDLK
jgi:hypothetical protein